MSQTETLDKLADDADDLFFKAAIRLMELIATHPDTTVGLRRDAQMAIAPIMERLENIQSEAGAVLRRMA